MTTDKLDLSLYITEPGFMYGPRDEENPIFPGGWDNFGYYDGVAIPGQPLTLEQRIEAQIRLYDKLVRAADIGCDDVVLEVACGRGRGPKRLMETCSPAAMYGVDRSVHQVRRALATLAGVEGAHVLSAEAEALPFADNSVTRAISLEATQHFASPEAFVGELGRVVRDGGRIAVASFFSYNEGAGPELAKLLPTFENGTDHAVNINDMLEWLNNAGFTDIQITSIGEHVFERFVEWRNVYKEPDMGWFRAYKDGLLEYYIIAATKNYHK